MPSAITVRPTTGACTIVARPVAALNASGEASLTTLQQVSVSVSYDDLYSVTLSNTEAKRLLDSFTLDGSGSTFGCTLSNSTEFTTVLADAMARSTGVSFSDNDSDGHVVGNTLSQNLVKEIIAQFSVIYENELPNILESEWDISNNVAFADGAADMAAKLTAAEAEILAQQIPESNYVAYMDASENTITHALPLLGGDKLVLVFYLTQNAVSRVNKKTAGSLADDGTGAVPADAATTGGITTSSPLAAPGEGQAGLSGPYGDTQQAVTYTTSVRTVAFELTMGAAGAALGLKA